MCTRGEQASRASSACVEVRAADTIGGLAALVGNDFRYPFTDRLLR